jgi:chromosome segregation ATPase
VDEFKKEVDKYKSQNILINKKYSTLVKEMDSLRTKSTNFKPPSKDPSRANIENELIDNLESQIKNLTKNYSNMDENEIISSLIDESDVLKKDLEKSNNINIKLRNMMKNTDAKIQGYTEDITKLKSDISKKNEEIKR